MSRESDLAALKEMKSRIEQSYTYLERCKAINAKCEALEKEKNKTAPPPITLKATNNYDKLKSQFNNEWRNKHTSNSKFRIAFLTVNTLLMLAIGVAVIADIYAKTGLFISVEQADIITAKVESAILAFATFSHVLITALLIVIPFKVE